MLTTPVLRCIKQQLPGVVIHYLTKAQFVSLLEANPYIDKVIPLDASLSTTAKALKAENYDQIIDLHHNLRTLRVKLLLGKPAFSFNKLNLKKWLLVTLKWDKLPRIHIVDRYLETVKHLGVNNDGQGLDFFIPSSTPAPPLPYPIYITFAIGGQHATKKMPNHKIAALLDKIQLPIVLLGGKEDAANGEEIIKTATHARVTNLCGQLSLHQSALVVKGAQALISHDTGMMHIGAALDIPILSVWGNTVPQFGMYPYYKKDSKAALKAEMFEVTGLSCRPCSKIGYDKCPKGHFDCMEKQDVGRISNFLNSKF